MASVPQGSYESKLFFLLYINDVPTSPGTRTNLYVDDTMFVHSNMSKHHATLKIPTQIDVTTKWLKDWRISITSGKTVAMLFGDKKPNNIQSININGCDIKWNSSVKYLGIQIDCKLRFAQNICKMCFRSRNILVTFYPMLIYQSPIPIRCKILIVKMYINTILMYASPAWGEGPNFRHQQETTRDSTKHCSPLNDEDSPLLQELSDSQISQHPNHPRSTITKNISLYNHFYSTPSQQYYPVHEYGWMENKMFAKLLELISLFF